MNTKSKWLALRRVALQVMGGRRVWLGYEEPETLGALLWLESHGHVAARFSSAPRTRELRSVVVYQLRASLREVAGSLTDRSRMVAALNGLVAARRPLTEENVLGRLSEKA